VNGLVTATGPAGQRRTCVPCYVRHYGHAVPDWRPVPVDLCDHDRRNCAECFTTCRLCGHVAADVAALTEHVAAAHVIGEYDCKRCGRPMGH
jgi:hypothetical protein